MSSYRMERKDAVCQLSVNGGLTAVLVPEIQQALRQEIANGAQQITFDLAETSMMDSSGIGLLIAAGNSLAQKSGAVSVVNTAPEILKLLASMRLVSRLKVSARAGGEQHHE
jgi:anti-anti-sigma factor